MHIEICLSYVIFREIPWTHRVPTRRYLAVPTVWPFIHRYLYDMHHLIHCCTMADVFTGIYFFDSQCYCTMYGPYGNRNAKGKTMPAERYCFSWVCPLIPMDNWSKCIWTYWWSIKLLNRIEFRYMCIIMHRRKQNGRYYHLRMISPDVMCMLEGE